MEKLKGFREAFKTTIGRSQLELFITIQGHLVTMKIKRSPFGSGWFVLVRGYTQSVHGTYLGFKCKESVGYGVARRLARQWLELLTEMMDGSGE